jgi:hypothetical protein
MQQRFNTRNYSVRDFEEWHEKDELVLAPKFQRREVWSPKARSFLVDTIIRGKPIPKIYMRQDMNPKTRRTTREIVDGQQRLHTILTYIKDGFKVSRTHNEDYGGKFFSQLDSTTQKDILRYEFVVDLLQDMPDADVYDVFARINTYSVSLKPQELRNAKWFGDFKTAVYGLGNEFVTFWETNNIFSPKQMLRMAEAEFVSELLIAMSVGIREGSKTAIDGFYRQWDDTFPARKTHEKRFRDVLDTVGSILGPDLPQLRLRATRLFYPLFCAIYHLRFGLPKLNATRKSLKTSDYPKLKVALEEVDSLLERIEAAEEAHEEVTLSAEQRRFYDAYSEHWVHADKRTTLTEYISRLLVEALPN